MRRKVRLRLDAAGIFVAACWAAGLGLDFWIVKGNGHRQAPLRPITDWARDNPALALAPLAVLALHIADVLGPLDPFALLGRLLGPVESPVGKLGALAPEGASIWDSPTN